MHTFRIPDKMCTYREHFIDVLKFQYVITLLHNSIRLEIFNIPALFIHIKF
jgi:hypothetical protein